MISKKLSLNKVCIILATTILLLSVVMLSVLYILTKEMSVVFCLFNHGRYEKNRCENCARRGFLAQLLHIMCYAF